MVSLSSTLTLLPRSVFGWNLLGYSQAMAEHLVLTHGRTTSCIKICMMRPWVPVYIHNICEKKLLRAMVAPQLAVVVPDVDPSRLSAQVTISLVMSSKLFEWQSLPGYLRFIRNSRKKHLASLWKKSQSNPWGSVAQEGGCWKVIALSQLGLLLFSFGKRQNYGSLWGGGGSFMDKFFIYP